MRRKILRYKPELKELARRLRTNSTLSEKLLWIHLKGKQIFGYDFDRQKPIDNYFVDFFCKELLLAIEIDGKTHNEKMEEDKIRQERLEKFGVRFIRVTDEEVRMNPEGAASFIREWIKTNIKNKAWLIN
jgi:very-short-patch-repair endonuclease